MIGRDMAGCLTLPLLALVVIVTSCVLQPILRSLHAHGLWICYALSLASALVGIVLLAYARMPLYRQGRFLFVGPKQLPKDRLPAYQWAWRFIGLTLCIQVILLLATR
jgi:hypothetical protein